MTLGDPTDINAWSGLDSYILKSLRMQGSLDVIPLGPLTPVSRLLRLWFWLLRGVYNKLLRARYGFYHHERHPLRARHYAKVIKRLIRKLGPFDVICSPTSITVSYLTDVSTPSVFWTDATFASLTAEYWNYRDKCKRYYREGHTLERLALETTSRAIYSSDWAAHSAAKDYGTDSSRISVVPFGANVECLHSSEDVSRAALDRLSRSDLRLIFVGKDFDRKGGRRTLDLVRALIALGVKTTLTVYGTTLAVQPADESFIDIKGVFDKSDPVSCEEYTNTLLCCHFLVLLSEAECYGLVLCEANSLGVPCIASAVGGIPTIIRDGLNGLLVEASDPVEIIAERILSVRNNSEDYLMMSEHARSEFEQRLNWRSAGSKVAGILRDIAKLRKGDNDECSAERSMRQRL